MPVADGGAVPAKACEGEAVGFAVVAGGLAVTDVDERVLREVGMERHVHEAGESGGLDGREAGNGCGIEDAIADDAEFAAAFGDEDGAGVGEHHAEGRLKSFGDGEGQVAFDAAVESVGGVRKWWRGPVDAFGGTAALGFRLVLAGSAAGRSGGLLGLCEKGDERGEGGDERERGTEFHDKRLYSEWRAIAAGSAFGCIFQLVTMKVMGVFAVSGWSGGGPAAWYPEEAWNQADPGGA